MQILAAMSFKTKYGATVAILAGRGATRRVMFERGVVMVLAPLAVVCVWAIIYNGRALLFNVAREYPYGVAPRWKVVMDDLLMTGYGGFGLFCEVAGLNSFRMVEKKFDLITLLAFVVGLVNVLGILMFGTLVLVGLADLIWPGQLRLG